MAAFVRTKSLRREYRERGEHLPLLMSKEGGWEKKEPGIHGSEGGNDILPEPRNVGATFPCEWHKLPLEVCDERKGAPVYTDLSQLLDSCPKKHAKSHQLVDFRAGFFCRPHLEKGPLNYARLRMANRKSQLPSAERSTFGTKDGISCFLQSS